MKVRRCAWVIAPVASRGKLNSRPVWARKNVVSLACPKSIITALSLDLLERFTYWKSGVCGSLMNEEAKVADALLFLNELWTEEMKNGEVEEKL